MQRRNNMTWTRYHVFLFRRFSFVAAFQDAETRQKLDLTVGLTTSSHTGPFFLSSSVSIGPPPSGSEPRGTLTDTCEKKENNKTVISYFQLISASAARCNLQLYKVRRLPHRGKSPSFATLYIGGILL